MTQICSIQLLTIFLMNQNLTTLDQNLDGSDDDEPTSEKPNPNEPNLIIHDEISACVMIDEQNPDIPNFDTHDLADKLLFVDQPKIL